MEDDTDLGEQHDELQLPTVFGRYLLLRRLSQGGMGEIFLAKTGEIQGFEKLFVIKKILPELSKNTDFTRRFVDEAKITIKLNQGNIVPVFEVGVVGDDYFLALEYVEGRDLRRILSRCYEHGMAMPPDLALMVARDVANGLSYAHRRTDEQGESLQLVHCDISPPNVLVSLEGEVKIIDFGVSRSADQVSQEDPAIGFGKFGYMAPEQILKGREVDRRTDLYALGVVLYEMLVGDRMVEFSEEDEYRQIARRVVLGEVELPSARRPELGDRFDGIVARAVAKEPARHYQTAAEFRDELQRCLLEVNPTVSTDDLASFVRNLFTEELEYERELIRQAKATDVSKFGKELHKAQEATVSYAMTDIWSVSAAGWELAGGDQLQSGPEPALELPRSRVPLWVWPAAAAGVVLVVVLAILLWPKPSSKSSGVSRVETAEASRDAGPPKTTRTMEAPVMASMSMDRPPDMPAMNPTMHRAPDMRTMRRRRRRITWRPRPRIRAMDTMKPDAMAAQLQAAVKAKFRRVRGQYAAFKSKYGQRLERYWLRILKTAVYSGADRYPRLNRQLDDLRRRMARVRRQAP